MRAAGPAASQTAGAAMKAIVEFLSLRPIWTRRGLEAIWYVCLGATVIQLGYLVNLMYFLAASTVGGFHLSLIQSTYSILFTLVHLAIVRMFLEMALNFLVRPREQ
jgi:hypothetical protein